MTASSLNSKDYDLMVAESLESFHVLMKPTTSSNCAYHHLIRFRSISIRALARLASHHASRKELRVSISSDSYVPLSLILAVLCQTDFIWYRCYMSQLICFRIIFRCSVSGNPDKADYFGPRALNNLCTPTGFTVSMKPFSQSHPLGY